MLHRPRAVPEGRECEAREGWEGLSPEARGSREVSARENLWRVEVRDDETMQAGEPSSGFPIYDLIEDIHMQGFLDSVDTQNVGKS